MSEWQETTVGEICEVFDGPHATPRKTESGPIFLGITSLQNGRIDLSETEHLSVEDFKRWTRRVTPRTGDVVFSYETKLGEAAIIPDGLRCCLGRRMALMRPHPNKVDGRFLLYYYLGAEFRDVIRERTIHGSTVDRIALIEFPKFPVRVPALPEQRAIAAVLGALDDKIELNRRMNETLEALAQSLFKSWFVDAPQAALPKGWRQGTLGEVAENPRRGVRPDEIEPSTPYIGLEHMPRRCIALSDWGHAEELQSNKFEFKRGEILFGRLRPYFHKVGVAPVEGVCSTDILVVAPKKPAWFGFMLGHVSSVELVNHTDAASTGTKMPRTNWSDIARYEVALPPGALAAKFSELTQPLVDRIIGNILESRTLAALRDALLPKLLSGELRVPAAMLAAQPGVAGAGARTDTDTHGRRGKTDA